MGASQSQHRAPPCPSPTRSLATVTGCCRADSDWGPEMGRAGCRPLTPWRMLPGSYQREHVTSRCVHPCRLPCWASRQRAHVPAPNSPAVPTGQSAQVSLDRNQTPVCGRAGAGDRPEVWSCKAGGFSPPDYTIISKQNHYFELAENRCKVSAPIGPSLRAQLVKNPPAMQETPVRFLGREDPLEKGKATHSSILAWRIPWTS